MASVNQDFVTYSGDSVSPIFTVTNRTGTVVDISTVTNITWQGKADADSTAIITKTKTGGGITFVTTGVDGQFQVALTGVDTAAFAAVGSMFVHTASITDASGNVTTTTIGRMQVGLAPMFTYDPAQITTNSVYAVRDLIGDTKPGDVLLTDPEIRISTTNFSNSYLAAADCCRKIAARFGRDVDTQQGELRTMYSSRRKAYQSLGIDLEQRGYARGGIMGYAGGISQSDKDSYVSDTDRVQPQFNIGMMDDLIPTGPIGHETPGSPLPFNTDE